MVPATEKENLTKLVKQELKRTMGPKGVKTLCQGDGGMSIKERLVRSDPLNSGGGPRPRCTICRREGRVQGVSCWKSGFGYSVGCSRSPCIKKSPGGTRTHLAVYQGETSRTGFTRIWTHFN